MDWAWAYHSQQAMAKKSDIFPLFWDWWDINKRNVAFCIIIPIILELCLADYFMHTLFMQITFNLFDCNFMLPLHHQCKLLHGQHPRIDLHDLWVLSWKLWCTYDELRWFCTHLNSLMNVRKSGATSMYNADLIRNHHQLVGLRPIAVFMRLIHKIKCINRLLNNKNIRVYRKPHH